MGSSIAQSQALGHYIYETLKLNLQLHNLQILFK